VLTQAKQKFLPLSKELISTLKSTRKTPSWLSMSNLPLELSKGKLRKLLDILELNWSQENTKQEAKKQISET
jgi:hypothetical protein